MRPALQNAIYIIRCGRSVFGELVMHQQKCWGKNVNTHSMCPTAIKCSFLSAHSMCGWFCETIAVFFLRLMPASVTGAPVNADALKGNGAAFRTPAAVHVLEALRSRCSHFRRRRRRRRRLTIALRSDEKGLPPIKKNPSSARARYRFIFISTSGLFTPFEIRCRRRLRCTTCRFLSPPASAHNRQPVD